MEIKVRKFIMLTWTGLGIERHFQQILSSLYYACYGHTLLF